DLNVRREVRHGHASERNLSSPERFDVDVEFQNASVKERRTSNRFADMQSQSIETRAEQPPAKVKISQLDSRPRGLLQLLHNVPASPPIHQAAGDRIGDDQSHHDRQGDSETQSVFQDRKSV